MALNILFYRPLGRLLLTLVILTNPAFGVIRTILCPGYLEDIIEGINEVIDVANSSSAVLKTFDSSVPWSNTTGDPRLAIYGALLNSDDKLTLIGYLDSIVRIGESPETEISIFCTNDFIIKKESPTDHREYWWDIEFHDNNSTEPVSLTVQDGELPSPTEKTFTKLGYNEGTNQNATTQAHIFLSPRTLNFSNDTSVDGRPLAKIREGLKPDRNFNHLDYLRPLSRSIMRELLTAVGGLVDPDLNAANVIDCPGKNTNISMFDDCLAQKNHYPATIVIAECLTIVAIGLYLQIHDKPTFWSTGVVNRDTLRAEDPGSSSNQDMALTLDFAA